MVTLDDPATPQDFDYLRALHNATLSAPMEQVLGWNEKKQLEWLRANFDADSLRIISLDSRVGCYDLKWGETEFFLAFFYIAPEFQGQGIASHILHSILHFTAYIGKPIRLTLLKGSPARRFFERRGFTLETEEPQLDHLIWWPAQKKNPATHA